MSGVSIMIILVVAFTLGVIAYLTVIGVAFTGAIKEWSRRRAPLSKIFTKGEAIHSVAPDTPVSTCVRLMTDAKIGALIVMDGERLTGIFTERDALNKVLSGGLDPGSTRVSEVMTKEPYCIPPTTTVSDALKLITKQRFRHLPITENGKVLAVVSSGDLTHWLVQDRTGEVKELMR